MSLKFTSQLNIDSMPAEAINSDFEVIMPTLNISLGMNKSKKQSTSSLKNIKEAIESAFTNYNYAPVVEEIRFTPRSFKTDTRRIRTQWLNVATDLNNMQTVNIVMFCSDGMLTQYYLDAWQRLIFDPDGEYYNPVEVYKKNIEIYFYGAASIGSFIPVAHFTLKGCFPVAQDSYTLKYSGDPQRLTISATFAVDRIVPDDSMARSAVKKELGCSPLSAANKLLESFSSGPETYTLSKTVD